MDVLLTPNGQRQAEATGKYLAGKIRFDRLFVSHYERTLQTAELMVKHFPCDSGYSQRKAGARRIFARHVRLQKVDSPERYEIWDLRRTALRLRLQRAVSARQRDGPFSAPGFAFIFPVLNSIDLLKSCTSVINKL
jgi:broad specificity phosphatase PhoE